MAGQDAVNSARAFHEALPLTGVILTKTDGDARGGVALSVREVTGLPIKLVGTGEKVDALEPFVPSRFASRILGMGDVVGLVEQVQKTSRPRGDGALAGKVKQGQELEPRGLSASSSSRWPTWAASSSCSTSCPGSSPSSSRPRSSTRRCCRRQIGIIDSMTPGRAAPSGPHRRLAQTADRRGRRAADPRRQPAAEAAQTARQDHEAAVQGRAACRSSRDARAAHRRKGGGPGPAWSVAAALTDRRRPCRGLHSAPN